MERLGEVVVSNETNNKTRRDIEAVKATKAVDRRTMLSMTAAGLAGSLLAYTAGSAAHQPSATQLPRRRRFEGKVVLITGATSGIGRAAAIAFAGEGGKVGFCGRGEQLGQEVERQIKVAGGDATYVRADVRVEGDVKTFVDQIVATYGRLDVAFNNAGITIERPLHEYSSQEWDDVLDTNLRGVFLAMKYEIPHMIAGGGGNIVVTFVLQRDRYHGSPLRLHGEQTWARWSGPVCRFGLRVQRNPGEHAHSWNDRYCAGPTSCWNGKSARFNMESDG